jgi:hypothetical protein
MACYQNREWQMSFNIVQINGLWHAVFTNGHQTEGFHNANMAYGAANAYIVSESIKAGK